MRLITLAFLTFFAASPVWAQSPAPTTAPVQGDGGFSQLAPLEAGALDDNAPIRMTPDGPAVIQLNQDAASVIIGNPAQATAILENPRLIMLMPQQPGATKIIALDREGKAILNRHVLVGGGKSQFIRINKPCGTMSTSSACRPAAVYYCPDRCYETNMPQPGTEAASSRPTPPAPVPLAPAPAVAPQPASTPASGEETIIMEETGE